MVELNYANCWRFYYTTQTIDGEIKCKQSIVKKTTQTIDGWIK